MILIKPSYEILSDLDNDKIIKDLEKIARTCYKSEDKITEESGQNLIKTLIKNGHEAMIEFADITVKIICDRGVSHELVRHRLCSFAQESTRYVDYTKDKFDNHCTFIIPSWTPDIMDGIFKSTDLTDPSLSSKSLLWLDAMLNAESTYRELRAKGWHAQEARSVLPNSTKTEINMKTNIRDWRHILKLRTAQASHPQMRQIMVPLLNELKQKLPIFFNDI